jgi:hypothetical protein
LISTQVAARIPGRIGKQCRERWTNHLDPNLKKGGWTPEEDAVMAAAQARWGNAWTKIAELLPGRAENAVKNRWNSAFRRNNAHAFGRATDDRVARALQEARRGMEIIDRAGSLLCGNQMVCAPRHRRDSVSVAASARWRGVFRPSTRCCLRDSVASMAWRFTKIHAIILRIT